MMAAGGAFPGLMAEAAQLCRLGEYGKALTCYNNALKLRAGDKNCLAARSNCHLKLGDTENALKDAEASLTTDKTFSKGIYQKAEVLYAMGDFEFALVYYHRGRRLRPDLEKFRLGIEKSQAAIVNCVGSPTSVKLKMNEDVCFISRQAESKEANQKFQIRLTKDQKRAKKQEPVRNPKIERQLLGELYADKVYLEKLLQDKVLTGDDPEESCKKAEKLLKTIQEWSEEEVPNKNELIGHLHSCIGKAQFDMGQTEAALQSHKMHLEVARQNDLPDAVSRALENIGRVYARTGKFQKAIDTWEEKIPMAKSRLEKTWLFHEIGRCYLELNKAEAAQNYGEKSLQSASEKGDVEWQLHAVVLVAQAEVKLKDYWSAITNFEKALEKAKFVHNEAAQKAIIAALNDVSKNFIEELNEGDHTAFYSFEDHNFRGVRTELCDLKKYD
ncbi:outer dynein arm-docking complex subunit 4 isoform X2 [Apus apus]|uniref:outer dynein arm-docking complex subunit 4 isoform X2 n=1 Tax=Apus apus TaxID=8895 RepID=UPI0021F8E463|nr:outer dynein arm-docking complex subunit 4 isoform X2 [Apus apus]